VLRVWIFLVNFVHEFFNFIDRFAGVGVCAEGGADAFGACRCGVFQVLQVGWSGAFWGGLVYGSASLKGVNMKDCIG